MEDRGVSLPQGWGEDVAKLDWFLRQSEVGNVVIGDVKRSRSYCNRLYCEWMLGIPA